MTNKQYAVIGFLAPSLFLTTYLVMSNLRPEYSFMTKAISELGSVDAPNKWVWNVLGYILPGTFIAVYGFGLHKNSVPKMTSKLPFIGIFFSGIFMAISGIFPGDFDDKQSLTMLLHTVGSFGSYLFFLIGAFTFPNQMKKIDYWKDAVKPTLICTWMTIIFGSWVFVFPNYPAVGQRIVFLFYFLWIVITAYKLYHQNEHKLLL
jgi:hypothetical membrane protein